MVHRVLRDGRGSHGDPRVVVEASGGRTRCALVFAERTRVSRDIHDAAAGTAIGLELEAIASQLDAAPGSASESLGASVVR